MAEQIVGHNCGEKFNGDCLVLSVGPRHAYYENIIDMSLGTTCNATCMTPAFSSSDNLCGLVVRVSGYRYRGPGFDPRLYQIF